MYNIGTAPYIAVALEARSPANEPFFSHVFVVDAYSWATSTATNAGESKGFIVSTGEIP